MFTRAGFNPRHRRICRARVIVRGRGVHWAELLLFVPSGELAWYSKSGSFLGWTADTVNVFNLPRAMDIVRWSWPSSRLPR